MTRAAKIAENECQERWIDRTAAHILKIQDMGHHGSLGSIATHQPFTDSRDPFGTNPSTTTVRKNIGVQWDDQQALLR